MNVADGFIVWSVLTPALFLLGFAAVTLLFGVFQADRGFLAGVALTGVAGAAWFAFDLLMEAHQGAAEAGFGLRYLAEIGRAHV